MVMHFSRIVPILRKTRTLEVIDPFGNRLTFGERLG